MSAFIPNLKGILFIIVGWYFSNIKYYKKVLELSKRDPNLSIFISSHKLEKEIEIETLEVINEIRKGQIHYFDNIGYDWGAYSQAISFLGDQILSYESVFFMHDDIKILDLDFIIPFLNYMKKNNLVILGNSFNTDTLYWPKTHSHIMDWAKNSKWKINIESKAWKTIRGSFFVSKNCVFEQIKQLPFKQGDDIRYGNWASIIFTGIVSDIFGINSVGTMSEKKFISPFVSEFERGVVVSLSKLKILKVIRKIFQPISYIYNKYIRKYKNIKNY